MGNRGMEKRGEKKQKTKYKTNSNMSIVILNVNVTINTYTHTHTLLQFPRAIYVKEEITMLLRYGLTRGSYLRMI